MVRMAGGTQKPGMLGAWAPAGQKRRNWLSGQPQERTDGLGREEGQNEKKQKQSRWARELWERGGWEYRHPAGEGARKELERALAPVEADRTAGRLQLCAHGSEMSQACQKTAWPLLAPAGPC